MDQPEYLLDDGTPVQTTETLGTTDGLLVKREYIENRRPREQGVVRGVVGGHGGDVYWVQHPNGEVGVYGWWEMDLV